MGIELLTERYQGQIAGVLSCYDRIIMQGTVPGWCYARGMTEYFYTHQIRIFDYTDFAQPLRDLAQGEPAELIAICERAMERDIGRRYADVTALRDTQRALAKEEEHFRFLVENSNDFVTVLDENG